MPDLAGILAREIELVSRFISLLDQEQDSLKKANADALQAITAEKMPLIAQMNSAEGERMAAIGATGQPGAKASMQRWLEDNTADAAVAKNWQQLLELAREAKALHDLNIQLVEMHLRNATEALAILTQPPESSSLYGASGQTMGSSGSRIVDSA
ncbi:flagella synthesis protein FlgN [Dechloromonas sp. ARDL1]|uniref:flagella synthesis protein FlgN n=1 Tax=Dechloromonas sp. ARDL1 TaxID=3322121 RepID=UPI003DA6CF9C